MKPVEKSNQKISDKSLTNPDKLSSALQAYFEARDALFKQYNLDCPKLQKK